MQQLVEVTQKVGSDGISHTTTLKFSTLGNHTIIAAPTAPAKRIVVTAFNINNLETQNPVVAILSSGISYNGCNGWTKHLEDASDELQVVFPPGHGWMLNQGEALILNTDAAVGVYCNVQWYYVTY